MAECPSGRYAEEIVTASGLTVASPTDDTTGLLGGALDWSGSESKFAEWDALTVALVGRLESTWMRFTTWPATSKFDVATYNDFVERINSIRDRYSKVRKPWTSSASAVGNPAWYWGITTPDVAWDASDEIGILVQVCIDAQCLREQLDKALVDMGANPPTPGSGHLPGDKREGLGVVGTIATVAIGGSIIAGTILLARKVGRS